MNAMPYPKPYFYPLFEYMEQEHGLTLTDSQLYEIVLVVRQIPDNTEKQNHQLKEEK